VFRSAIAITCSLALLLGSLVADLPAPQSVEAVGVSQAPHDNLPAILEAVDSSQQLACGQRLPSPHPVASSAIWMPFQAATRAVENSTPSPTSATLRTLRILWQI
jgi:hypothetical protein